MRPQTFFFFFFFFLTIRPVWWGASPVFTRRPPSRAPPGRGGGVGEGERGGGGGAGIESLPPAKRSRGAAGAAGGRLWRCPPGAALRAPAAAPAPLSAGREPPTVRPDEAGDDAFGIPWWQIDRAPGVAQPADVVARHITWRAPGGAWPGRG